MKQVILLLLRITHFNSLPTIGAGGGTVFAGGFFFTGGRVGSTFHNVSAKQEREKHTHMYKEKDTNYLVGFGVLALTSNVPIL